MNISAEEARKMTEKWEQVEINRFYSALRPKSFREGKKAFDSCLQTGKIILSRNFSAHV